jgi:hypothetical protein
MCDLFIRRFSKRDSSAQILLLDLAADDASADALLLEGVTSVCMKNAEGSALSKLFVKLFKSGQLPSSSSSSNGGAASFLQDLGLHFSFPNAAAAAEMPIPASALRVAAFSSSSSSSSSSSLPSSSTAPFSPDGERDIRALELRLIEANMDLALLPRANSIAGGCALFDVFAFMSVHVLLRRSAGRGFQRAPCRRSLHVPCGRNLRGGFPAEGSLLRVM